MKNRFSKWLCLVLLTALIVTAGIAVGDTAAKYTTSADVGSFNLDIKGQKLTYVLASGNSSNNNGYLYGSRWALKNKLTSFNSGATQLVFGSYEDYADNITDTWDAASGANRWVDTKNAGTIRLFKDKNDSTITYILSQGSIQMHPNSGNLFYEMNKLVAIRGLDKVIPAK